MNFKYIHQSSALLILVTAVLLQSCLGSSYEYETSSDAQIYSFTAAATYDSTSVLTNTVFAIDQLAAPNPKIYPRDSLAYGFELKNAFLTVSTESSNAITIFLANPDSSFVWNRSDSIDLTRLRQLEVYAIDAETKKTYDFEIYVHQQDPDTLIWKNIANNYISPATIDAQKTLHIGNQYITYYTSGTALNAAAATVGNEAVWNSATIAGLPADVRLSSLTVLPDEGAEAAYCLGRDGKVYQSDNGLLWNEVSATYPVRVIYGMMPSLSVDSALVVVSDNQRLMFAKTADFTSFRVVSEIPAGFPVDNFTAISFEDTEAYTAKHIVIAGGVDKEGAEVNKIWVMGEKDGAITRLNGASTYRLQGASMFVYDTKYLYMLTSNDFNKNLLVRSTDFGLSWSVAPGKQIFPSEFAYRQNASVITDNKNYIWIFGGISGTQSSISDVWRGRLNRLAVI